MKHYLVCAAIMAFFTVFEFLGKIEDFFHPHDIEFDWDENGNYYSEL